MNAIVETITPAKAMEYFDTSLGNRHLSKPTIQSYADSMKAGKWMLNGVPIVFDIDGHLIDGHHRLQAIIEADIPVQISVVRGVESSAFVTFDCGLHRTLGQLLAMQSKKNYNTVGSIVLASEVLRKHGRLWANNSRKPGGKKISNYDNYEIYAKDPNRYDYAGELACNYIREANIIKGSWVGGLYYYLTTTGGYSDDTVKHFFDKLCSYKTSDIPAIELLRTRLLDIKTRHLNMDAELLFALITKTWNAYIDKVDLKRLVYNKDTEKDYPTLKLNTK